jgi:hypothetical protein
LTAAQLDSTVVKRMADSTAMVRASYAKTVIGGIKRRPERERDALMSAIGEPLRAEIRNYGMLEWMPAQRFAELVGAIATALGPAAAKSFWRANLLLSLERRLLSPLRLGAIALYGNSPRSLLKMTPQAWELVTRNGGTCCTEDLPANGIVLRFSALPRELCLPAMQHLWSGGSESCLERMSFQGEAHAEVGATTGCVDITVRWKPR